MAASIFEYNVAQKLRKNVFVRTGYDFKGWATSSGGSVVYADEETLTFTPDSSKTVYLYAVWQAKEYSIIYRNLMSNMVVYPKTYTYGVGLSTMPNIMLEGEVLPNFYGWYTSDSFLTKITSISPWRTGDIILYAKYDFYLGTTLGSGYVETVTDGNIYDQPSYDIWLFLGSLYLYYDQLESTTLSKVKITISMSLWELDDGYQQFFIYNGDSVIWSYDHEHGPGYKETNKDTFEMTIYFNIEDLKEVDNLTLRFGARGSWSDDWQFTDFTMSVYYTN